MRCHATLHQLALCGSLVASLVAGQSAFVYDQQNPRGLMSDAGTLTRETGTEPPVPGQCSTPGASTTFLNATVDTVSWGYFYRGIEPAAVVSSGDTIDVELLSHEGGNAYDLMVAGDPAVEAVYEWTPEGQTISFRGPSGAGSGVHVLTGPIYVCGAEPGDVLQVEILDVQPRPNPGKDGRTFGSNTAGSWGYQNIAGFKDGDVREVVTIYEVIRNEEGVPAYAIPDHSFRWADAATNYYSTVTPCTATEGDVPRAAAGGEAVWQNDLRNYTKGVTTLPCIDRVQTWPKYAYPGCDASAAVRDYSIRGKWRVPLNMHIGNMGIAPALNIPASSVPPSGPTGGNIDNRRIGAGATMYYPVQVAGALLSAGDAHSAMGDSELDGTGIETSVNVRLRITVQKQGPTMPQFLHNLSFPLLENVNEYITHGFTYADYLTDLAKPATDASKPNPQALDMAMIETYKNTRNFMMTAFNLTEDQAISAMTVGVDYAVAQVVNGVHGMHATIPKWMFNASVPSMANGMYIPTVIRGTSQPLSQVMDLSTIMGPSASA